MKIIGIHNQIMSRKYYLIYCLICLIFWTRPVQYRKFVGICNQQYYKGLHKYNHTIDECDYKKFDWEIMMTEELIDFFVYVKKHKNGK